MIIGGITSAIWPIFRSAFPNVALFQFYEIVPGFLIAVLFIYLFSRKKNIAEIS